MWGYVGTVTALVIALVIPNCLGMSKTVFQLALYLRNQSEIVFISDDFPDTIPDRFRHLFQLSFIKFSGNDVLASDFYVKLARNYTQSVKIIVALPTIPETLRAVAQIGNSSVLQANPSQSSVYAVWPLIPLDELDANKTLQANFKHTNVSGQFTPERDLYVVFTNRTLGTAQSVDNGTAGNTSPLGVIRQYSFYEVYTVNQQFISRKVRMITTICPNCTTQTARRKDLQGLPLRFEGVQDKEYNDDTLFVQRNDSIVQFDSSLSTNLVALLQKSLNFTIIPIKASEWGKVVDGKSYGVIADVSEGKADVGISTTAMIPIRARIISYLPPTDEYVITAFFKPPSLNAIRDIFMQPFEPDLWAAVLATWLTLASSMILFTFIRKKVGAHNNNKSDPNAVEPDFTQDSMIWALATACQQGWDEHPTALSLRAIFISGSFTAVIAYAGYSAAIVSTLSVRIDPIQNPAQLIKSNLRLGMRDGFFREIIPEDKENPDIVTDVYKKLSSREEEKFVNITTGVTLLKKYSYAFISQKEAFYDILKDPKNQTSDVEICGIKELRLLKQGFKAGMFTAKNFPYREFFRLVLIMIRERGILWRLRNDFTYTRRCLEASDNAGRALGGNDVFTAFMILCGGYILSTFFLVIEKLICFYKFNYMYVVTP